MTASTGRTRHPPRGTAFGDLIRAFPLPAFFVIAYLMSWAYWLVVLGLLDRGSLAWIVPGAFGPPLAALLVTAVADGRDGLRAFLRRWVLWRVAPRWYLVALVGFPALGLVVGSPFRDGTERSAGAGPAVVVSYLAVLSLLWHLPVFVFVPGYNSAGTGVAGIATSVLIFTGVGSVGQSLLLTWLFNHTRGSVLIAVLAHASLNAGEGFFVAPGPAASMAVSAAFGVVGLIVTLATRGTLAYRPGGTSSAP